MKTLILIIAFSNISYANQYSNNINNKDIDVIIKQKRVEDFKLLIKIWENVKKWSNF